MGLISFYYFVVNLHAFACICKTRCFKVLRASAVPAFFVLGCSTGIARAHGLFYGHRPCPPFLWNSVSGASSIQKRIFYLEMWSVSSIIVGSIRLYMSDVKFLDLFATDVFTES